MAAYTAQAIYDRVSSIVATHPYAYRRALEPFSFDLQPQQALDRSFHITIQHGDTDGYLGFAQAEIDVLRIHLLRTCKRDVHTKHREIVADITSLVASVERDGSGADYSADVVDWEVSEPGIDDAFVMGRVEFTVDYDRAV